MTGKPSHPIKGVTLVASPVLPKPLSQSLPKETSSLLPLGSGDALVPSSPPGPAPLPIEGTVTLEKFYEYFKARSDHTDQLYNLLLQESRSNDQETTALLNGFYIDFATFKEELKGLKKTVKQIAENYWKGHTLERPISGPYAAPITPARRLIPEPGSWRDQKKSGMHHQIHRSSSFVARYVSLNVKC